MLGKESHVYAMPQLVSVPPCSISPESHIHLLNMDLTCKVTITSRYSTARFVWTCIPLVVHEVYRVGVGGGGGCSKRLATDTDGSDPEHCTQKLSTILLTVA